ncbi:MAG: hypothetical protein E6J88_15795 [Deltaproteobacteria bacterium]|nr:MAG: hypothetical protein E6J88_15795 [Deltaproteobacteria bacterium]
MRAAGQDRARACARACGPEGPARRPDRPRAPRAPPSRCRARPYRGRAPRPRRAPGSPSAPAFCRRPAPRQS